MMISMWLYCGCFFFMFVYDHAIGTTMHMLSLNYLYFYLLMNKTIYFISLELLGAVSQGYNNPRSFYFSYGSE